MSLPDSLPRRAHLLLCGLALFCGCPDDGTRGDAGDLGASDALSQPDLRPRRDGLIKGEVGSRCDVSAGGCDGKAVCVDLRAGLGVCVIPGCTLEDPRTPRREDNCPAGTACARITLKPSGSGAGERNVCLRRCSPDEADKPCDRWNPSLSCDPASILLTGYTEVCGAPTCNTDEDCGNRDPFDPDSRCDETTGVCLSRGSASVKIGAPCTSGAQCGPGQHCLPEQSAAIAGRVRGGYCTIIGCRYGDPWACPSGSRCVGLASATGPSLCLATGCDPTAAPAKDGCRDKSSGYRCYALGDDPVCWVETPSSD